VQSVHSLGPTKGKYKLLVLVELTDCPSMVCRIIILMRHHPIMTPFLIGPLEQPVLSATDFVRSLLTPEEFMH